MVNRCGLAVLLGLIFGCGGQEAAPAERQSAELGRVDARFAKEIPAPASTSGVIYVSHQASTALRVFRVDRGILQRVDDGFTLGNGDDQTTNDMALDAESDLLFVVSDVGQHVDIYRLHRPATAADDISMPVLVHTIETRGHYPVLAEVDPYNKRLYINAIAESDTSFAIHVYDYSNLDRVAPVNGSPFIVPAAAAIALDAPRQLLFCVSIRDSLLRAYDVSDDTLREIEGEPLALSENANGTNSTRFSVPHLNVDPWSGRLFVTRNQWDLSEPMVFNYIPEVRGSVPFNHEDIERLSGPANVSLPATDRAPIVFGGTTLVDPLSGASFFMGNTWTGTGLGGAMFPITPDLTFDSACQDFPSSGSGDPDIGCALQVYVNRQPAGAPYSEGYGCVLPSQRMVVSVSTENAESSQLFVHAYGRDSAIVPVLTAEGYTASTSTLPIAVACH